MPSATAQPITVNTLVDHQRFGRGRVRFFDPVFAEASVLFDKDARTCAPTRVLLRDLRPALVVVPARPALRVVA